MLEGFSEVPILQGSSFLSITNVGLSFNKNVVKKMQKPEYILLLCNEDKKQIAIQKCDKRRENSIQFYHDEKSLKMGVKFSNREVQQMIAELMNWDFKEFNYRVDGFMTDDKNTMIFDLNSAKKTAKKNKRKKDA